MSVVNGETPPAVRTPGPLPASRRRALERLGQGLRAMGLGAIGDIGSTSFGTVSTITWESATDWDNAVSEAGVVHETYGDLPGGDVVQLGYPSFDRGGSSLVQFHPYYENSGSTANDVSGNGNDGTLFGGFTQGATGLHNLDTYDGDGTDDEVVTTDNWSTSGAFTVAFWIRPENTNNDTPHSKSDNTSPRYYFHINQDGNNKYAFDIESGSGFRTLRSGVTVNTGVWEHIVLLYNGSSCVLYVNGVQEASASMSSLTTGDGDAAKWWNHESATGKHFQGRMAMPRVYLRALSLSEIQGLYDAGTGGSITTATKSFSSPQTPDLSNLTYSLNGQSVTVDVIGSPGTASEEVVSQTLDGSTGYALTWSGSHTDFRVKPQISTTNVEVSPTVSSITLSS